MKHELTLSNGRGKDQVIVTNVGSKGDKLLTVTMKSALVPVTVSVRLTGDEWRALKEWR